MKPEICTTFYLVYQFNLVYIGIPGLFDSDVISVRVLYDKVSGRNEFR